jgi:hypothetical protein
MTSASEPPCVGKVDAPAKTDTLSFVMWLDGWRVVDDDDYNQSVGNPKRKV